MRWEKYVKKDVEEDDFLRNYKNQPSASVIMLKWPSLNWQQTNQSRLSRKGSLWSLDKRSFNASPVGPKL